MTPSFTRAEYWLLEAAVENYVKIAQTGNGVAADILNRSDHGVTHEELVAAYERLSRDGLIIGLSPRRDRWKLVRLKRTQIERELARKERRHYFEDGIFIDDFPEVSLRYQLTRRGGAAWEAFAHPNWERYIGDFCALDTEEMTGDAIGIDKGWLERYIRTHRWPNWLIVQESAVWDVVEPWHATYWKKFRSAHRVQFRIVPSEEPLEARSWGNWYWYLREWYHWRS